MAGIVQSELLKMKYTFCGKLIFLAPFFTLLLGYFLGGSSIQYAAYNWWQVILFPMAISLWCADMMKKEKNTGFYNILCLPVSFRKIWIGKNLAVILFLFVTDFLMWMGCTVFGYFTVMNITPLHGMVGCIFLFLASIWQVPFIMTLSAKIGYLPAILLSLAGNILLSGAAVGKKWFFLNPYAIPARIVCPFFGTYYNGLLLEKDSPFWETEWVLPALIISLVLAGLLLAGSTIWFSKRSHEYE
ncbi:MAG: lantibiotic immunity ABC transporter MutE/EpiE family permease subunit [Blautia sp.]|nr:lantibiotic immunity ABC transporter MutE/EpiE family permease subunit [Lachnoclostridium sp.]MCM1212811.1 lantibiotic immunity ABC transporter MutE/EpiE family permease subunit [Blautia sp.]